MRYLLLIYNEETGQMEGASPEQQAAEMQKWDDYGKWLTEKGWIRGGDALQPSAQATTVRVRKGQTLSTDGPFAETKVPLHPWGVKKGRGASTGPRWGRARPPSAGRLPTRRA